MVNILLPSTFSKAIKVIQHIEKKGFNAYFVGGCVRDLIIGRPVGDIDIATSAKPFDIQHIFRKVIPVGIEHGTVIVRWEGDSFEVTTFRLENTYSDQRHPDNVTFVQTIDQDLKRRDFTMNAIAMDKTGNIVDPYGGKKDIEHRQIRAVGNGYDRFHEDPLRIIRAVRFSSQLGFTIEKHTLNDMLKVRDQIRHLAVERLTVEITKLFAGDFIDKGMSYLNKTRILNELPIFKEHHDIVDVLPQKMIPLYSFGEVIALLQTLYPSVLVSTWVSKWKDSNKTKQEADTLTQTIQYFSEHGLDKWLAYMIPASYVHKFVRLANILVLENRPEPDDFTRIQKEIPIESKRDL